jgi:hypothetical protein
MAQITRYLGHFGLPRAFSAILFFRREIFRTCFCFKVLWRYLRFAKWPSSRDGKACNVVSWKLPARTSLGNWGWLGLGNNITVDFLRDFRTCSLQQILVARYYMFAEYNQRDATFHNLFISVGRSTCFRRFFRPSSGAQNCTYSVRCLLDHYWYLLLARLAVESSIGLTNTWRCLRSFELLMMDGKPVWNM